MAWWQESMESRLVPSTAINFMESPVVDLEVKIYYYSKSFISSRALGFFKLVIVFIKYRPNIVIGMGGYASGIGGLISKIFFVPLFIHEQNYCSWNNKQTFEQTCFKCFQAFEDTFPEKSEAITTGNPILFNPIPKNEPNQLKTYSFWVALWVPKKLIKLFLRLNHV